MDTNTKFLQGTPAWFEMVSTIMCEFATSAGLASDQNVSFVERYSDGTAMADGLVQGIRFEIINGQPAFRIGVRPDERGDINIEITAAAARMLNLLYSADPEYHALQSIFLRSGEMRVEGDPSALGSWLAAVHDPIVDRTD